MFMNGVLSTEKAEAAEAVQIMGGKIGEVNLESPYVVMARIIQRANKAKVHLIGEHTYARYKNLSMLSKDSEKITSKETQEDKDSQKVTLKSLFK